MKKEELNESPEKEASESPKDEAREEASGEEGVTVPEEFQKKCYSIFSDATKQELSFARDCIYQCEEALRKAEKPKGKSEGNFTMSDGPEL